MLADVVQFEIAVGVGPEPTLGAVKAGAVVGARGKIPEGDGHRLSIDPLPVERVKLVPLSTQPVLTIGISSVSPPELPGEKTLQRRIGFIHQRSTAILTKVKCLLEILGLLSIEYVTLPIVGGRAARFLVPEGGTSLDRESLVSVDKGLADGEGDSRRAFKVDRDKGARHGRVARQEKRSAFFDDPSESVAYIGLFYIMDNYLQDKELYIGCLHRFVAILYYGISFYLQIGFTPKSGRLFPK